MLREIFGEYRAPTGVGRPQSQRGAADSLGRCRDRVDAVSDRLGRRIKFLVGKPGLDGHSNGAEQIAVRARDAGIEVVYEGIRLTPAQIVNAAARRGRPRRRPVDPFRLARPLVTEVMERHAHGGPRRCAGRRRRHHSARGRAETLKAVGVARIYTPKDFDLNAIMADIVELVDERGEKAA